MTSLSLLAWIGFGGELSSEFACAVGFDVPTFRIDVPPRSSGPAKLSFSDLASSSNFPLFTTAIENITMNSAISSVIMSA